MKSKILKTLAVAGLVLGAGFGLVGCGPTEQKTQPSALETQIRAVYALAQESGYTGTYEEWLASIKGETGAKGDNIELRVNDVNGYIEWKTTSESIYDWKRLISVNDLKGQDGSTPIIRNGYWWIDGVNTGIKAEGEKGDKGQKGDKGDDGVRGTKWYTGPVTPIEMFGVNNSLYGDSILSGDFYLDTLTSDVYELMYYTNTDNYIWRLMVNLNANVEKVEVSFDTNLPAYMYEFFDKYAEIPTQTIEKGSWCTLETFENSKLKDYFLGWYLGEGYNETKVNSYTVICDNCTLVAKWDYDKIDETYTSAGVRYKSGYGGSCNLELTSNCGEVVHVSKMFGNERVAEVEKFADAINTTEVLLHGCVGVGVYGWYVSDPTPEKWNNSSLQKVSWYGDATITSIGRYAFYGCAALKYINIPDTVTTIYDYAFAYCIGLENFNLSSVTVIKNYAFANCTSLKNLNIWDLETIGDYAFYNCSELRLSAYGMSALYITESVETIGNNAFEGCLLLNTIYINSEAIANLTNNNSCLFSYADKIYIKKSITTDPTSYLDDSQGHYKRSVTGSLDSHDILNKVVE